MLEGYWLLIGCVAVLLLVFFGWVVWPPADITRIHEVSTDVNLHEMPYTTVDPMIRCRTCRVPIRHVKVDVGGWRQGPSLVPTLRCPDCDDPLPVLRWVDRTHVEVAR